MNMTRCRFKNLNSFVRIIMIIIAQKEKVLAHEKTEITPIGHIQTGFVQALQ